MPRFFDLIVEANYSSLCIDFIILSLNVLFGLPSYFAWWRTAYSAKAIAIPKSADLPSST